MHQTSHILYVKKFRGFYTLNDIRHLSNSLNLYFYWLEEYTQILLLYVKIWLATMTTWNGLRAAWLASLTYISTHTRLRPGLIHLAQSNSKQQQLGGIFMRTQNRAHTSWSDTKLFYILKARCGKILYNPEKKTQSTGDVHYLSVILSTKLIAWVLAQWIEYYWCQIFDVPSPPPIVFILMTRNDPGHAGRI